MIKRPVQTLKLAHQALRAATTPRLNGKILVSVDIQDDARAAEVRKAFAEFDAKDVSGN